ncbi:hypothetical protein JZ785_01420 [Alicyclobacillus curvatus]|nr:hypothetical protein JZ785_01420 [Alicyclobacillus curvatus]
MNDILQSIRQTVKHGLAIVLFTLLLLGMMGAALGLFSAGISALTDHQNPTSAVPTLGTRTGGSGRAASPALSQQGSTQGGIQGGIQGSVQGSVQGGNASGGTQGGIQTGGTQGGTQAGGAQGGSLANPQVGSGQNYTPSGSGAAGASQTPSTAQTGQDLANRLSEQLRNMQSPVTGRLDSGGVALGNQVQTMFGHFLSGLLQTLFVEQANGSQSSVQGSGYAQGGGGGQGIGTGQTGQTTPSGTGSGQASGAGQGTGTN